MHPKSIITQEDALSDKIFSTFYTNMLIIIQTLKPMVSKVDVRRYRENVLRQSINCLLTEVMQF